MSTPTPRPGILDIDPYVAGDSDTPGATRIIKLSSNECALGPSPKAITAFREAGNHLYRYPDSAATELRAAIAGEYGLDAVKIKKENKNKNTRSAPPGASAAPAVHNPRRNVQELPRPPTTHTHRPITPPDKPRRSQPPRFAQRCPRRLARR